jgi:uncharacterized protein (TIGR03067 family)
MVITVLLALGVVLFGAGLLTHQIAAGQQTKTDADKPASGQPDPIKQDAAKEPLFMVPFADAGTVTEAGAKHETARTDLDRLQGVWSVVSIQQPGRMPSKVGKVFFFMVDGKRACWQSSDWEMQGGLYLDPTSKPRTYDLAMSSRTIEGIYALEGDTLRLCYDLGTESKRPGRFVVEKGSQQVLVVLKRIHGPEVFPFRLADGTRAFPTLIERAGTKPAPPPRLVPQPVPSGLGPAPEKRQPSQYGDKKE